ncbi:serine/threonine-protein kinase [Tessaracoccus sp. Y1736]
MTEHAGFVVADRYELTDEVPKRGGMAHVYTGADRQQGDMVAVKFPTGAMSVDGAFRARLHRERALLSRIEHPNVVRVRDAGTGPAPWAGPHEDHPYIVMDHVRGETLQEKLKVTRRFTAEAVVDITLQVLAGLQAMHSDPQVILHRDIKPSNVMIDGDGRVTIIDLGIAKSSSDAPVTLTGLQPGSPQYASPEQLLGQPLDPRSDIYSVGCLMYKMLTGSLPFGALEASTGARPAVVPPSVRADDPSLELLDGVVLKALQPQREDRFASAHEMAAAISTAQAAREEITIVDGGATTPAMRGDTRIDPARVDAVRAPAGIPAAHLVVAEQSKRALRSSVHRPQAAYDEVVRAAVTTTVKERVTRALLIGVAIGVGAAILLAMMGVLAVLGK